MNSEEREALRQEISRRKRENVPRDPGMVDLPTPGTRTPRSNGRGLAAPTHVTHGTETAYTNYKCRCDACRAASAASKRRRYKEGSTRVRTHNSGGYSNGCRCETCTRAHRDYHREKAAAKRAAA